MDETEKQCENNAIDKIKKTLKADVNPLFFRIINISSNEEKLTEVIQQSRFDKIQTLIFTNNNTNVYIRIQI